MPILHLLLGAIFVLICAPQHDCIECYTNYFKGNEKNLLGSNGKRGIYTVDCPEATECFEALANPVVGLDAAMYSSGCSDCPSWHYPVDCKKCSLSKCNRVIAKSIWTNHRECFVANDEIIMGKRRAYCTKGIDTCYSIEVRDDNNQLRYTANCGSGWPGCSTCKENLCNASPSVRKTVQDEVRKIEEEEAKESGKNGSDSGDSQRKHKKSDLDAKDGKKSDVKLEDNEDSGGSRLSHARAYVFLLIICVLATRHFH